MAQQLEPRIQINLEVKVWGLDVYGRPFVQHARTVNVTSVGARLIGIDCVREGEVISLQHQDRQSRCRVIWVGRDAAKARQIGIRSIEEGKALFEASLKSSAAKAAAASTPSMFAGRPRTGLRPHTARSVMPEAQGTRRSQQRFHCTGGVELRRSESAPPVFGNLSDISLTGCYVQTVSTLPAGTELLFMIRVRDTVLRGRAQVMTSHHAVGVGLIFTEVNKDDQPKLEFLVGTLAGSQELRPDQGLAVAEDPLPARQGFSGSARPAANAGASNMSVQITRTIAELNQLEQALVIDQVDPRIIAQFHDAVEHIRQTAWSAVQWADLNSSGGDPFEVLPQLEAERMHMLRKLAHNVTADLDSGSITRYTEGISHVYEVVQALYRGLRKIVMDGAEE
jgi:PilZ domain-containing protein